MRLPGPNESETLWSDEDCVNTRLRLHCTAGPWPKKSDPIVHRYTLHAEMCEVFEEEDGTTVEDWIPTSVPPQALSATMRILIELGRAASPTLVSILRVVKGKAELPTKKPAKIARMQGWSVMISPEGSLTNGDPLFGIQFSRPLTAEELVVVIGQFAKAVDHYESANE